MLKNDCRPELDVDAQRANSLALGSSTQVLLLSQNSKRSLLGHLGQLNAGTVLPLSHTLEGDGTRVVSTIDTMTEAHQANASNQLRPHPGVGIVVAANSVKHVEHRARSTTMERTRQGTDTTGDGSANISTGRSSDARSESGSVEAVIDGENQVGLHRPNVLDRRLAASNAPEIALSVAGIAVLETRTPTSVQDFDDARRQSAESENFFDSFVLAIRN